MFEIQYIIYGPDKKPYSSSNCSTRRGAIRHHEDVMGGKWAERHEMGDRVKKVMIEIIKRGGR